VVSEMVTLVRGGGPKSRMRAWRMKMGNVLNNDVMPEDVETELLEL
jgi:hypothetical protein